MGVVIVIACIVGAIILIFFIMKNVITWNNVLWHFKHGNVIIGGHKGSGKDILTQHVIFDRKREEYYANIDYGYKYNHVELNQVSVKPNTYNNFINGDIVKSEHKFMEKADIYISDAGNFLPSQMDSSLHKAYPSMPIFYSLSRHLYNSNVHCNSQNIERVWKPLREQADYFIIVKRTWNIFNLIFITKYYAYDRYESARQNLLPMPVRLFNRYSKSQADLFRSQNGEINEGIIITFRNQLKYDTRAFEKILLTGDRIQQPKKHKN